jgi:hypothetical protein
MGQDSCASQCFPPARRARRWLLRELDAATRRDRAAELLRGCGGVRRRCAEADICAAITLSNPHRPVHDMQRHAARVAEACHATARDHDVRRFRTAYGVSIGKHDGPSFGVTAVRSALRIEQSVQRNTRRRRARTRAHSMFNVSSQHWRKASQAGFVRVPCTDAALQVFMIDRSREIAFSRVGCAGRAAPRKSCDSTLEGAVHGRAWRLSCVGRQRGWEDSAHVHSEFLGLESRVGEGKTSSP